LHKGGTLKAEDVQFSINRARKDPASTMKQLLSVIITVDALDAFRLRIRTSIPDPLLAYHLSSVFISSKTDPANLSKHPDGTSSYRFIRSDSGTIEVEAFPQCWRGAPSIRRVLFTTVTPETEVVRDLKQHTTDILRWVPESVLEEVASIPGVKVVTQESLRVGYLWMNSQSGPFSNVKVRQAASLAINRPELIRRQGGHVTRLGQLIPDGMLGNFPDLEQPESSLDQAVQWMKESGYPNGTDTELYCAEGVGPLAKILREMLARIGIRTEIKVLDWPVLRSRWQSGQLPLFFGSWKFTSGEPSGFLKDCIFSRNTGETTSWNPGYSNPEADRMISQYLFAFDQKQRVTNLKALMKLLNAELPVIPLFRRMDLYAVSTRVRWQPRLDGNLHANEISFVTPEF